MVIYNDWLVPGGYNGFCMFPFIVLKTKCKHDISILKHEQVHWKQQLKYLILPFFLLYLLSKRMRLKFEVEAYREQDKWKPGDQSEAYARVLATKYRVWPFGGLGVTVEEAARLLRK